MCNTDLSIPPNPTNAHSTQIILIIQAYSEDVPSKATIPNSHVSNGTVTLLNVKLVSLDMLFPMEDAFKTPAQLDITSDMENVFKTQQDVLSSMILPTVLNVSLDTLWPMESVTELL